MPNPITCYLVGGAPLSGKTTLAKILAAQHQAVQISTDNIRDWMKRLSKPSDYPDLHYGAGLNAEQFYREFDTPQKVLQGEISQGKDVAIGIMAFLQCGLPWERIVIEGIAITPEFARQIAKEMPNISFEARFLYDDNQQRIQERIDRRGLWGPSGTYPDYLKAKEYDWVRLYNQFYLDKSATYGYAITHVDELAEA